MRFVSCLARRDKHCESSLPVRYAWVVGCRCNTMLFIIDASLILSTQPHLILIASIFSSFQASSACTPAPSPSTTHTLATPTPHPL